MIDNTNKVVIIEHPAIYDAFILALIISQTQKTVEVYHWHSRQRDWSDESKRRKITAVRRILGPKGVFEPLRLNAIHNFIQQAQIDFTNGQKQVRIEFNERVLKMELP